VRPVLASAFALVLLSPLGCEPPEAPAQPVSPPPASVAAPLLPTSPYPQAKRGDVVETLHGHRVADPYRWMEEMDAPETRAWIEAENKLTDRWFGDVGGRASLRARIAAISQVESYGPPMKRGARYFWVHSDGHSNQPFLETAASVDAAPATLIDFNSFSKGGEQAFAGFAVSPDGARVAYGIAAGGGDWQVWRVRDVATGKDLPDELRFIKYYAPAFAPDGKGIYYSRFPQPAPGKELTETDHDCKVYLHKLGAPAEHDAVVYARPDHPTEQFDLTVTRDGRYLVITIGDGQVGDRSMEQVAVIDLKRSTAKPVLLVDRYEDEWLFVGNDGPRLLFKTNAKALNKRIVALAAGGGAPPKEIVPEGKLAIDDARVLGDKLYVATIQDAHSTAAIYDLQGRRLRDVALPALASAYGVSGGPGEKEFFTYSTAMTTPGTVTRHDLSTGKSSSWRPPKLAFDPAALETRQVFFTSKDGTKVPMFLVAKKGVALDGSNPTIITGYGFGGVPMLPWFEPSQVAWVERGGVVGVVNVRGGGEYGEAWHHAAWKTKRQTCFDDFIAAGEWLVANHWTSHEHLGAFGTSGGGMLVGAVLVQRPDLFAAVAPIAGVHDLLRFQLFGQGAGWQGDLGSPDDPAELAFLLGISPLHNVRAGARYPATFVVTSDHDVRVAPLHSYKFAAALQAAGAAGGGPILLRVETDSGHGGGSALSQQIDQSTELLSFFAKSLGLEL
jgi:prolyl oligopeptidase